jgi:hypothetical protein
LRRTPIYLAQDKVRSAYFPLGFRSASARISRTASLTQKAF